MSPIVQMVTAILLQLPQEIGAIKSAVDSIRHLLSVTDATELDNLFKAENDKTDLDVTQFDKDAATHGG